jgi:hypothetical protein
MHVEAHLAVRDRLIARASTRRSSAARFASSAARGRVTMRASSPIVAGERIAVL